MQTVKSQMYVRLLLFFVFLFIPSRSFAGDDASGPVRYGADFGQQFTTYQLANKDKAWGANLAKKFKYTGRIVYFVRTSIPLTIDGTLVVGEIYQAVGEPDYFYVVPGDAMLKLGTKWVFSPGVGGFSMHAPNSRNFIACLNCLTGGVPFLSSSPVVRGEVTWSGNDSNRF